MRRCKLVGALLCAAVLILSKCGAQVQVGMEETGINEQVSETAKADTDGQITQLEEGLSLVRLDGDDGFIDFLQNGGASSDIAVAQFLTQKLLLGEVEFAFPNDGFGCSTILAPTEDDTYLFGRNFDWYDCEALIVENHPMHGYSSLSTVNTDFIKRSLGTLGTMLGDDTLTRIAVYAPLDGMNEQGLYVSVNMIEDSDTIDQNTDKSDLTTTTAVRLLLNEAADVEEAVTLLESYDLHASFGYMVHFSVADVSGHSVAIEYVDNEMVVTDSSVVTNFYLAQGEKNGIGTVQSHTRYETLQNRLVQQAYFTVEDVMQSLEAVSKHHFHDGETTEWSVIYDAAAGVARYYHRENYDTYYDVTWK